MQTLSKEELLHINGGIGLAGAIAIIAAVVFIIGVIDGFVRPLPCRK